jgi:hypothetical protein
MGSGSEDLLNERLGFSTVTTPGPTSRRQRGVHDEEGRLRRRGLRSEGLRDGRERFGGDLERHVWGGEGAWVLISGDSSSGNEYLFYVGCGGGYTRKV